MTQNLTSSSLSTDKPDYDKQTSSEIRADIDQTRASVGDKIDQLQARLDPNRLKQQAQETVQEMLNDTATSMTDYVKTHKDEMVTSLADAARRNPLPTALIGLGIGWLILESMSGPRQERRSTPRDYSSQQGYYPTTNWSPGQYNTGSSNVQPTGVPYNPTTGQDFSRGYGQQGFSQGYNQSAGQNYAGQNYAGPNYGQSSGRGSPEYNSSYNQGYQQDVRSTSGNGHQQGENPIAKATDAVKDSVGNMTNRVGDTVSDAKDSIGDSINNMGQRAGDMAGDMKDRAGDMAGDVKDRVGDVVQSAKESVGSVVNSMGQYIGDTMGGVRHQAHEMGRQGQHQYDRASGQMDQWQNQALYEGQRRGQQVVRNLEDNPLIYGAVAMAAGAALALLLPQSRMENRAFGEMRDQVMERGQEMLGAAKDHAQQVFEEVRPDLEQSARQIVSNVTETGKQAVRDAADQLSPVVDKAMTKGKEEARSAAKEIGVDPNILSSGNQSAGNQPSGNQSGGNQTSSSQSSGSQMSGSQMSGSQPSTAQRTKSQMPVVNRDTLSGQWKQIKGNVKSKWGQLTDDDMTRIEGDYDKLVGAIQTRYGYTREHTERELNNFFNSQTV